MKKRNYRVSLYVTEKEYQQLQVLCRAQQDSGSNVLRRMFRDFYAAWSEEFKRKGARNRNEFYS